MISKRDILFQVKEKMRLNVTDEVREAIWEGQPAVGVPMTYMMIIDDIRRSGLKVERVPESEEYVEHLKITWPEEIPEFEQYEHHGNLVWTRTVTKGNHRAMCLCYKCELFKPDQDDNCYVADKVYKNCVSHGLVTPVFECPKFVELMEKAEEDEED